MLHTPAQGRDKNRKRRGLHWETSRLMKRRGLTQGVMCINKGAAWCGWLAARGRVGDNLVGDLELATRRGAACRRQVDPQPSRKIFLNIYALHHTCCENFKRSKTRRALYASIAPASSRSTSPPASRARVAATHPFPHRLGPVPGYAGFSERRILPSCLTNVGWRLTLQFPSPWLVSRSSRPGRSRARLRHVLLLQRVVRSWLLFLSLEWVDIPAVRG